MSASKEVQAEALEIKNKIRSNILVKSPELIKQDLIDGVYGRKYTKTSASTMVSKVLRETIGVEEADKNEYRKLFAAKYMDLYDKSYNDKNWNCCRSILDSISRLYGLNEPETVKIEGLDFRLNLDV